ncbi:MAG TPA: MFS transporter [Streptosporangiaceae bacterium]|nr:MFS transporter [Streptosporangiaceae bacterium]
MTHTTTADPADQRPRRAAIGALYAAGFTTAFGAHSVAANLGGYTGGHGESLLALGVLLALYDGAEVLLKPVFGAVADRIGPRPVLLGGLAAFALFSAAFAAAGNPALVGVARLGQGAAASAFSPAAGALVARLNPQARRGRAFGGYGLYKNFGYAGGPLLGGVLITAGGLRLLFAVTAVLAAAVAGWAAVIVPAMSPQPGSRQTALGLARRLADRGFIVPVTGLVGATAALSAGVGFLPVRGAATGLGPVATGAAVSLLAVTSAIAQPLAGRIRDLGRISDASGMAAGLLLAAAGVACAALLPGLDGLIPAALLAGFGVGTATPLGFAALAATAPPGRMGQTMGAAEVGRELGEAGGPLLVGAVATAAAVPAGLLALAALLGAAGVSIKGTSPRSRPPRADRAGTAAAQGDGASR